MGEGVCILYFKHISIYARVQWRETVLSAQRQGFHRHRSTRCCHFGNNNIVSLEKTTHLCKNAHTDARTHAQAGTHALPHTQTHTRWKQVRNSLLKKKVTGNRSVVTVKSLAETHLIHVGTTHYVPRKQKIYRNNCNR